MWRTPFDTPHLELTPLGRLSNGSLYIFFFSFLFFKIFIIVIILLTESLCPEVSIGVPLHLHSIQFC